MTHTYEPHRSLPIRALNFLSPLFKAIGEFFNGVPLSEQIQGHNETRKAKLSELRAFENECVRLRMLAAKKQLQVWQLEKSWQEWVDYSTAHFYIQLGLLYKRHGFLSEVERLERQSRKGETLTTKHFDEFGGFAGIETITTKDDGAIQTKRKSNAFELEL